MKSYIYLISAESFLDERSSDLTPVDGSSAQAYEQFVDSRLHPLSSADRSQG